jgi:hypothetical protein
VGNGGLRAIRADDGAPVEKVRMYSLRNLLVAVLLCLGHAAGAQVTNTAMSTDDAFLLTGSPNYQDGADLTGLNFGGAGTLAVAPASSAKGEFQSVIKFDLAASLALFNSTYGSNNWSVTSIWLELTSNYGVAGVQPNNPIFNRISGGQFVIEWLADDNWVEGTGDPSNPTTDGVTYNSLPALLAAAREALCTNLYTPPGNNVHVTWPLPLTANLLANIAAGGEVTFRFYAADSQVGYLFNSHSYGRGNDPLIHVAATQLLKILSGTFTGDGFLLIGAGSPDTACQVEASSVMPAAHWEILGMAIADNAGIIRFNDSGAATNALRFYRFAQ